MREDLESEIVTGALAMAIANRSPGPGLIHHSDRGSQYTSLAFGKALSDSGLVASMGRSGSALRQRPHRELLCNPEIGADPRSGLPHPGTGQDRDLQLHRGVLQPSPAPLGAGLYES